MALLRHSGIYFLARILAGGASFALIAAYTRLLDPRAFGELVLAMAGVGFFTALIIYGVMPAMLRFMPHDSRAARATTLWGLLVPAIALCCVVLLASLFIASTQWQVLLALCAGLLLATLLHQFQLATTQGALSPGKYALLGGLESCLDMVLGVGLVWLGFGVAGALAGAMMAALLTVAINWRGWWINWKFFDPVLGRQMLRFGLPLILGALFLWLATFADRWLLATFVSTGQAGLYAAGYDLQMNLLGVPLAVMLLAGYPLTINAYAELGTQAAQTQLRLLGSFIILIVLPEAVGIVMTGPLLVNILLGEEFRPLTLTLLPILTAATFFKVLLMYANYGYVLGARTDLSLLAMGAAAAVDLMLDLMLIPHYGAWGAAIAALIGSVAGFAIAAVKMRQAFPFPLPDPAIVVAGLLGVAAMMGWLLPFYYVMAWSAALYVFPVAILVHFGAVYLFLHFTGRKPIELLRGLWGNDNKRAAA